MMNKNHIFIDTNVLIGAFLGKENDVKCLKFLETLKGKKLFISSLSVAQFVSVFQKHKLKNSQDLKAIVKNFLAKYEIISFAKNDIENSLNLEGKDLEDNIQFELGKKLKCCYLITNNKKDYRDFEISVVSPKNIRQFLIYS